MILTVIALIIQLLPGILQSAGVISPAMSKLISQLGAAVPGLITSLAQGKSVPDDVLALLKAFQSEIAALKASPTTLAPGALQMADSLDSALTSALAAYEDAGKKTDPSNLTDLPVSL